MKIRSWASLAMVALFLTGCKGFWDPPSGGGGGGTTTLTSGDFYVLNIATSQMVGLYVNAGTLTALPGSPYTFSSAPLAIAVAPNNAFLYVSTLGGIFVYTINTTTGQLTLANNGQAITLDVATAVQVDPTNTWLIEGGPGTNGVFAIKIDPSTGLLATAGENQIPASLPSSTINQIAISPDGTFVLVANGSSGTATIPFNAANANPFGTVGRINQISTTSGASLSVAFDPVTSSNRTPRLFYIGETVATTGSNTGGLRAFDFSTVKEITGSPYAISGLAPYSILPLSSGAYVYVVNRQTSSGSTGVIAGFAVTSSSSAVALTALGSTFAAGTNSQAIVEDSSNDFVFAVNFGGSPDVTGYVFNATKAGYLDKVITNATGTDPVEAGAIGALH